MKILLAPTWELAATVMADVTIEAEYGARVAEGLLYTAAHHQPEGDKYAGTHVGGSRRAPCMDANLRKYHRAEVVLVSHLDLDTVGGILHMLDGVRHMEVSYEASIAEFRQFWELAEVCDVTGPHKVDRKHPDFPRLAAWWAWSRDNLTRHSRDQIHDVTAEVYLAVAVLRRILEGNEELLAAGQELLKDEEALNGASFCSMSTFEIGSQHPVLVREHENFVNHLYRWHDRVCAVVVAFNTEQKTITISKAGPEVPINCRQLVQDLWGPLAGGHEGIAGGPRGVEMDRSEVNRLVNAVAEAFAVAYANVR